MESQNINHEDEKIIENRKLNIWEALIPVVALVIMLAINVYIFEDDSLGGSNQFVLLLGATVAGIIGYFNKVSYKSMIEEVAQNLKSTTGAILILLMVGALAGTWFISGIIPSMIYYGMEILNPTIFLAACVIICAVISVSTGSSWTTTATVGIALIGIAAALDISAGMTAGAVLSGAYFGDKLSPLSDTTNLAPAMAGTDLFTHIKYMSLTTVPTILVTLTAFIIIGLTFDSVGDADVTKYQKVLDDTFNITPWLLLVPVIVIGLIVKKVSPLLALLIGTLLAGIFALFFQPELVLLVSGMEDWNAMSMYKGIMNSITVKVEVPPITNDSVLAEEMSDLFKGKGMAEMLGTIWLIICAMVFGGIMDAIGALATISRALLNLFDSVFGLFASTVVSCLAINVTASDQYLALVVPGKMYSSAFRDKGLAPENLSRTLEDSGTVTSALIPWNTCGAYQSETLGVSVGEYFVYAIFNWLSPFMTLLFAAFRIKIRQLSGTQAID
ncbi:Na+/H+ antiporter NhaC family protein [Nonlabens ponticola]|uniref:Sodium:proton antiporter n=1 Tax=Nonlabens ponticola TaxID=2496866 RepID=A0A3S9MXY2_9FLAO|nr:Na+/H+ antiporter NhaC family protein [Nonlabens ponticola]AZQ43992.1 sodium:proton antiporter [Nonlabens ponticola]